MGDVVGVHQDRGPGVEIRRAEFVDFISAVDVIGSRNHKQVAGRVERCVLVIGVGVVVIAQVGHAALDRVIPGARGIAIGISYDPSVANERYFEKSVLV